MVISTFLATSYRAHNKALNSLTSFAGTQTQCEAAPIFALRLCPLAFTEEMFGIAVLWLVAALVLVGLPVLITYKLWRTEACWQ